MCINHWRTFIDYIFLHHRTAANQKSEEDINKEAVRLVRELVGPVAAFKLIGMVPALPKTRSGKTARKSIADLARAKKVMVSALLMKKIGQLEAHINDLLLLQIPPTIEDPSVYGDIKKKLQNLGYALNAPDPE